MSRADLRRNLATYSELRKPTKHEYRKQVPAAISDNQHSYESETDNRGNLSKKEVSKELKLSCKTRTNRDRKLDP